MITLTAVLGAISVSQVMVCAATVSLATRTPTPKSLRKATTRARGWRLRRSRNEEPKVSRSKAIDQYSPIHFSEPSKHYELIIKHAKNADSQQYTKRLLMLHFQMAYYTIELFKLFGSLLYIK